MNKKNFTLASNYYEILDDEKIKELMKDYGLENEEEIYDFVNEQNEEELKMVFEDLEKILEKKYLIVTGTVGTWRGNFEGGKFLKNHNDLYSLVKDCDYFKIYYENNKLKMKCSHHDGTNYYTFKELTDKGLELALKRDFEHSKKLIDTLSKYNFFSRNIDLYGGVM